MPLSKQPLEVSLGGAVEEGNVKELVQPPRIREAKDCASLKGGAYTKRDQILTPGAVDPTTQGASHTDDALVTVATTTVRVYPDEDQSDPSESNPAPFTGWEATAFEPTEANAAKDHGDSATHIIDGVPRTLCMWNADSQGSYQVEERIGPTGQGWAGGTGAPSIAYDAINPGVGGWWSYLQTSGVQYAVFDADRQVGPEREYPPPAVIENPNGEPGASRCAEGNPCFPRVRAITETPVDPSDGTYFFVSCAGLSTPQRAIEDPDGDPVWADSPYGARLSTFSNFTAPPSSGGFPTEVRDIMDRNVSFPTPLGYPPPYGPPVVTSVADAQRQGPGMVLSLHDVDGNILESVRGDAATIRPSVPDPATNTNADLMLPGPPLDMVHVGGPGLNFIYTLHVDYNQFYPNNGNFPAEPWPAPGNSRPDINTIRIIQWWIRPDQPAGSRIEFVRELYLNDPSWVVPPPLPTTNTGVEWLNPVPDWTGAPAGEGQRDWPAGLHQTSDAEGRLLLVFSSTRVASIPYNLDYASIVWKDPFWEEGYLTRLKIGRVTAAPEVTSPDYGAERPPFAEFHYDSFARHCTGGTPGSLGRETTQMARGAWAGSFLTQPDDNGRRWLGVQTISNWDNVPYDLSPEDQDPSSPLEGVHPYVFHNGPQTYSASVVHTLIDTDLDFIPDASSAIPGAAIGSQGAYINNVGHAVVLYGSAAGDNRTGMQEIGAQTVGDLLSATSFLATRRSLPVPIQDGGGVDVGRFRQPPITRRGQVYPDFSAYVSAVAIAQILPFGQSLGSYQNNPYQLRVNLRVDDDGVVRWTSFQRYSPEQDYGSASIPEELRTLKPVASSSRSAPYEVQIQSPGPRLGALMVSQNAYVTVAGAAPMVVGGPQGMLAGTGLQAVTDNWVGVREGTDSGEVPRGTAVPIPPISLAAVGSTPSEEVTQLTVGSYLTSFDENGGEHRTVPHVTSLSPAYNLQAATNVDGFIAYLYGIPWQLSGIPLSETSSVELCLGRASDGDTPNAVALPELPFVSHEQWIISGPSSSSAQRFLSSDVYVERPFDYRTLWGAGSGGALYTWSGELAADAPDPSRSVAAASNRLWSISSVDPRKAQYTKLLRRGYAPEWNQNLTVRVPGTADPLTAVAALPDGRILLFSSTAIHYTYGSGPSDTGQGAGFAEPAYLSTDIGCTDPRSIVTGDFGCIFLSERGFYLIDRKLTVSFVGLPYEDTTDIAGLRLKGTASDALRSEVLFFTDRIEEDTTGYQTWVFNTLRGQWSTFVMPEALSVTERDGRPFWITQSGTFRARFDEEPATIDGSQGVMSLTTGWLPMAKVQGYGRTWELQITGERPLTAAGYSQSGLKVELLYDYDETPAETYFFNQPAEAGGANIKLRLRPRKQKSEALSVRFSEYAPPGIPPDEPFTGWRLDMLTVLVGIKVGLDKVPTTPRDNT